MLRQLTITTASPWPSLPKGDWALSDPQLIKRDEAFIDVGDHHHRQPRLDQERALIRIAQNQWPSAGPSDRTEFPSM